MGKEKQFFGSGKSTGYHKPGVIEEQYRATEFRKRVSEVRTQFRYDPKRRTMLVFCSICGEYRTIACFTNCIIIRKAIEPSSITGSGGGLAITESRQRGCGCGDE